MDGPGRGSLWMLIAGPAIWSAHFLLCYLSAAIWCAKVVGRDGALGDLRLLVAAYTAAALIGIGVFAYVGFRRHSLDGATLPHDFATAEDRHRFLGFATLLLSGLSAVGTIYVALPVLFVGSCQ